MSSFFLITIIMLLLCFIKQDISKKHRWNIYLLASMCFLCIMTGLRRYDIGNDTGAYFNFFDNIANGLYETDERIEAGFRYLTLLISNISHDYTIYLLITSTILFGTLYQYIQKFGFNSKVYVCLFWCFAYVSYVSPLRQSIGLCIVLLAIPLLLRKKIVYFAIACILAKYFHNSAIVCLILIPLSAIRPTTKRMLLIVSSISLMVLTDTITIFQDYFEDEYYRRYLSVQSGWIAATFNGIFSIIPFFIENKKQVNFNYLQENSRFKFYNLMKWGNILFSCAYILSIYTGGMGRIAYYFLPFVLSYWVYALQTMPIAKRKIAIFAVFTILIGYRIITLVLRPEWNSFFPYHFYWDQI